MTPDLDKTKQALNASQAAATVVTENAQGAISAVPTIPNPPDWYAPIQNDLEASQGHANTWLSKICPAFTRGVPSGIVSFNETFQTNSGQILDVLQEVGGGGEPLTQSQRDTVSGLLSSLSDQMAAQAQTIVSLQSDIKAYFTDINNDQDKLQADLGTVSAKFADSGKWIEKLTEVMGETFLDSNILGPCDVIVEINMNVSMQLGNVGSDPTLNALVMAKAILQNQISNFTATQQAVQAILDTWTTLKVKNDAVVVDLKDAQADEKYIEILTQLDLETAQDQWQQLADFASNMTN